MIENKAVAQGICYGIAAITALLAVFSRWVPGGGVWLGVSLFFGWCGHLIG